MTIRTDAQLKNATLKFTLKYTLVYLWLPHGGSRKRASGKSRVSGKPRAFLFVAASAYSEYSRRVVLKRIIEAVVQYAIGNHGTTRPPTTGRRTSSSPMVEAVTTTTRDLPQININLSEAKHITIVWVVNFPTQRVPYLSEPLILDYNTAFRLHCKGTTYSLAPTKWRYLTVVKQRMTWSTPQHSEPCDEHLLVRPLDNAKNSTAEIYQTCNGMSTVYMYPTPQYPTHSG